MQYLVQSTNLEERNEFYNYLINNGYTPVNNLKKQTIINNKFPFVIEENNTFWICESITCCAVASSNGRIISIKEYFNNINKDNSKLILKLKNNKKQTNL